MIIITVNELPGIRSRIRYISCEATAAQEIEQIAESFEQVFGRRPEVVYRCGTVVLMPFDDGDEEKIERMAL